MYYREKEQKTEDRNIKRWGTVLILLSQGDT
jgi:hypothetical protein